MTYCVKLNKVDNNGRNIEKRFNSYKSAIMYLWDNTIDSLKETDTSNYIISLYDKLVREGIVESVGCIRCDYEV